MREQEKQIEEMCKDYKLCYPCEMFGGYINDDGVISGDYGCIQGIDCTKCGVTKDLAKLLIIQGYRKVPEDSVMLSVEEVLEFREDQAKVKFLKNKLQDEARKETAEKFAKGLIKIIKENDVYLDWDDVLKFAKEQYGVEIKE